MTNLTASFITSDKNAQDGTVSHWFVVGGENYALSESSEGLTLLDCDGCPVDECNDHENIKQLLIDANPC